MARSQNEMPILLNAHLSFLGSRLCLIHIPLEAYALFIQPILQLLMHNSRTDDHGNVIAPPKPWMYWHPFVNFSLTPKGCSIVCPRHEAENLFAPVMENLSSKLRELVSISAEDYSVISILGEGIDAGQRVLDVTTPLANANISIFFITSYYSDYILVPYSARSRVIQALENQGFIFEAEANGDAGHMTSPNASPILQPGRCNTSSTCALDLPPSPGKPLPSNIQTLQSKIFRMLKKHGISPHVDESIELVTCAGVKDSTMTAFVNNNSEGKFQLGVTKCLTSIPLPKFLSLTLTDSESASLTMERRLISYFHNSGEDVLLGRDGPEEASITFDLASLPSESTGIICGVASCLREHMKVNEGFNMSYLSTAKAGHVIVYMDELDDAMLALRGIEQNGVQEHQ